MINFERIVILASLIIVSLLGIDIYDDLKHGSDTKHVMLEGFALLASLGLFLSYLLAFAKNLIKSNRSYDSRINYITLDRDKWRERSEQYLNGLGKAIDEQFNLWNLSESEKDIGLLILKGFAHKEIAEFRSTSERTVRQQAASIYAKAGIENKSQLSAFFMEDLMLPKA